MTPIAHEAAVSISPPVCSSRPFDRLEEAAG